MCLDKDAILHRTQKKLTTNELRDNMRDQICPTHLTTYMQERARHPLCRVQCVMAPDMQRTHTRKNKK